MEVSSTASAIIRQQQQANTANVNVNDNDTAGAVPLPAPAATNVNNGNAIAIAAPAPPNPAPITPSSRWRFEDMHVVVPGTFSSLALRVCQFSAAIVSFSVMISAANFSSVTAFCFLVAAMVLQCMWSLSVATIEGYALFCGRGLRDSPLLSLFAVGDWITAVVTFAGACASAGIAVLIAKDVHQGCDANYCGKYAGAAGMAFLSWFLISTSFLFTFWHLATR